MPRHKVDPLYRRRVAQACDGCKKRKEKCNGATPCEQCKSRHREDVCRYTSYKALAPSRHLLQEAVSNEDSDSDVHRALSALEDLASSEVLEQGDSSSLNCALVPKLSRMLRDGKGKFSKSYHPRNDPLDIN